MNFNWAEIDKIPLLYESAPNTHRNHKRQNYIWKQINQPFLLHCLCGKIMISVFFFNLLSKFANWEALRTFLLDLPSLSWSLSPIQYPPLVAFLKYWNSASLFTVAKSVRLKLRQNFCASFHVMGVLTNT